MKRIILIVGLITAALMGVNPADYDPFFDNPHDTYHIIAPRLAAKLAKQDDGIEGFHTPTPGPNAEACKSVWDNGKPCPVDGKFYGYWGELQPEYCNNNHFQPDGKTLKPDADKCHCNVAMTTDMKDCPMNDKGEPIQHYVQGFTCQVYCREKDHCHCVNICDAYVEPPESPAKGKTK